MVKIFEQISSSFGKAFGGPSMQRYNELSKYPNAFKKLTGPYSPAADGSVPNVYKEYVPTARAYQRRDFLNKFNTVFTERKELYANLESLRNNDIVQTVLDVLIDDGFYSMRPQELFTLEYSVDGRGDEEVQKVIDDFIKVHQIQSLIGNILEDFLLFGEYALSVQIEEGRGVVSIDDNINTEDIIGVYSTRGPQVFIKKVKNGLKFVAPNEIAHFLMADRKVKVKIEEGMSQALGQGTDGSEYHSDFIRVGRSAIYSAINKLKEIQVLETATLAKNLKRILAPLIVTIGVPGITPPERVSDLIKTYEKYLSDIFSTDTPVQNMSVGDILAAATNIKLLPNYTDGKGQIDQIFIAPDAGDQAQDLANQSRSNLGLTLGMPPYYFLADGQGTGKLESLKIYSRYSRKLVSIQQSIADGIKDLVYRHLRALNIYVLRSSLNVQFKPVSNVDLIDDMEFLVALSSSLDSVFGFLNNVAGSEFSGLSVDPEKLQVFVDSIFKVFPHAEGLLRPKTKEEIFQLRRQAFIRQNVEADDVLGVLGVPQIQPDVNVFGGGQEEFGFDTPDSGGSDEVFGSVESSEPVSSGSDGEESFGL